MRTSLSFVVVASLAMPSIALSEPILKWQGGGCDGSCDTGWYASPAIVDLTGDGTMEVVWGGYDVVALNGTDGSEIWRGASGNRMWPSPAVADLDGDGALEVVVGRGGDELTVYSATGAELWTENPFGDGEVRTLALADLDGSGPLEIIVGRGSGGDVEQVNVFEPDGNVRPGWPARRAGEPGYGWGMYNQNVTIGDLDGNGTREIFAPTDTHYITALDPDGNQLPANAMYGDGKVWSEVGVHVDQAADLEGFAECGTQHRPNFANSAPVIADVDGDGSFEIVVVGDVYDCSIGDPDGDVYHTPWILKGDRTRWAGSGFDWTTLPLPVSPGPLSQDYEVIQNDPTSAVVADLDNDGFKEILYPSYDGRLHAFWLDRTAHDNWPFVVPGSGINFASEPVVVDLEGDGPAEVIFTSWPENGGGRKGQLIVLNHDGSLRNALDLPDPLGDDWNGSLGAPSIGNIDDDPDMELVIGTTASGVVAYDLPNSGNARILWGTSRGSLLRSGNADDPGTVIGGEGGNGAGGNGNGGGSTGPGGPGSGADTGAGGGDGAADGDDASDGCDCSTASHAREHDWLFMLLAAAVATRRSVRRDR